MGAMAADDLMLQQARSPAYTVRRAGTAMAWSSDQICTLNSAGSKFSAARRMDYYGTKFSSEGVH